MSQPHSRAAGATSTTTTFPAGVIVPYAGIQASIPSGWLDCNGSALQSTSYPALYAAIGNNWGGNQATFNLPDLRGYFLRGVDEGAGNDPDAATRSTSVTNNQNGNGASGDTVGSSQADQVGPFTVNVPTQYSNANNVQANPFLTGYSENGLVGGYMANAPTNCASGAVPAQMSTTETRAKNKYVYWIISTGLSS